MGGPEAIPFVLTLYGTEIWHYKRRWPIESVSRARIARRPAVTFYSRKLLERATELGLSREDLVVVYPTIRSVTSRQSHPAPARNGGPHSASGSHRSFSM
jgi:hypothetical protein